MTESRATEPPAPTEGSVPVDSETRGKAEVPSSPSVASNAGTTSADVNAWKTKGDKQPQDFMETEEKNSRPWLNEPPEKEATPLMRSPPKSESPGRYDVVFDPPQTSLALNSHMPSPSADTQTVEKPAQPFTSGRPPKIGPPELDSGSEEYP